MTKTHQGQSFNFQTLSAIYYLFQENLDAFTVEGPNFEDSVFKKGNKIVAIGEAKYWKSKERWTSHSLFFQNGKGPLTQLWERDNNIKKLIFFSYSDLAEEIKYYDKINISKKDLNEIFRKMLEISNIKRKEDLTLQNLLTFIEKIYFKKYTTKELEELIIESLRAENFETSIEKLRMVEGYINSDDYKSGRFISRDELFRRLKIRNDKKYSMQLSFRNDVVECIKNMKTRIIFIPMAITDLHHRNNIEVERLLSNRSYYDRKIQEYNKMKPEFLRFKPINLYLLNIGEILCENISVKLETILNNDYKIEEAAYLGEPKKPSLRNRINYRTESSIRIINQGYEYMRKQAKKNKISPLYKQDLGEKTKYIINFRLDNIRPGASIELNPLYKIYIPISQSQSKIIFNCNFLHNGPKIDSQKLEIVID